MRQFIERNITEEKRLSKFNIMSVQYKNGYLTPKEPLKDETKSWLSAEEYEKGDEDYELGLHPEVHEYGLEAMKEKVEYIENNLGKRLVYPGHSNILPWMAKIAPGG